MARTTKGRIFKRGKTYWIDYQVNGTRVRESLKTANKAEAEKRQRAIVAPFTAGHARDKARTLADRAVMAEETYQAACDIHIANAWDEFARATLTNKAPGTVSGYQTAWHHFTAWLGVNRRDVQTIGQIDQRAALSYTEHLNTLARAARTYNKHRQCLLRMTGRLLLKAGSAEPNPWEATETQEGETSHKKNFTKAEVRHVLDSLSREDFTVPSKGERDSRPLACRDEWHLAYLVGTYTGLRLGDVAGMRWGAVNLAGNEFVVRPDKTKRYGNTVTIPIHPDARAELLKRAIGKDRDAPILPKLADRYARNPSGVRYDAVAVLQGCGFQTSKKIPGRDRAVSVYGFHSLRHSFVSFCANAGVPLAIVQEIVGHGSPEMTRLYYHVSREAAGKAIDALPSFSESGTDGTAEVQDRRSLARLADSLPIDVVSRLLAQAEGKRA